MSPLSGRKVLSARLHPTTVLYVPGVGQITSVLTPNSGKTLGALELTRLGDDVFVKGKGIEFSVPAVNFVVIVYEPEVAKST